MKVREEVYSYRRLSVSECRKNVLSVKERECAVSKARKVYIKVVLLGGVERSSSIERVIVLKI